VSSCQLGRCLAWISGSTLCLNFEVALFSVKRRGALMRSRALKRAPMGGGAEVVGTDEEEDGERDEEEDAEEKQEEEEEDEEEEDWRRTKMRRTKRLALKRLAPKRRRTDRVRRRTCWSWRTMRMGTRRTAREEGEDEEEEEEQQEE